MDLRRTRSSDNLLPSADSHDLGQSLFETGKPSFDQQDSVVERGNSISQLDSINETKKQESLEFPQKVTTASQDVPKSKVL